MRRRQPTPSGRSAITARRLAGLWRTEQRPCDCGKLRRYVAVLNRRSATGRALRLLVSLTGVQRRHRYDTGTQPTLTSRGQYQPRPVFIGRYSINGSLVKQFPLKLLVSTEIILRGNRPSPSKTKQKRTNPCYHCPRPPSPPVIGLFIFIPFRSIYHDPIIHCRGNPIRRDRPLTLDELMRVVPGVFGDDSTPRAVVRALYVYPDHRQCWKACNARLRAVFLACQARVRDPDRREYNKTHVMPASRWANHAKGGRKRVT